jgi:hypothetical protein
MLHTFVNSFPGSSGCETLTNFTALHLTRKFTDCYILVGIFLFFYHGAVKGNATENAALKVAGVKAFTFEELADITDQFDAKHVVGQGGYGKVYQGKLKDGQLVAIKVGSPMPILLAPFAAV